METNPIQELQFSDPPALNLVFQEDKLHHPQECENGLKVGDQETEEPVVTRRELYSYYLYSNSTNGMGPTRYSLTLLQSLANAAGFDPKGGPGFKCTTAGHCVIPFGAGHRATTVNSVVLIANAISFAIMTFIYTAFGGCADHGYFDQWILLFLSGFWWGSQLGLIGVTDPTQWRAAMALYIIGFTTYGAALVFIAASLPRLSRNMPYARKACSDFRRGLIQQEEYDQQSSLEKNRLSMISSVHFNIGSFFTLLLSLAIVGLNATARSTTNWTIAVSSVYSIVVGIWWFLFHQKRPGLPLPKGQSYVTIGVWTLYRALKECRHLPQTFLYLFASFLLADGVNTTTTLIYIVQGEAVTFSSLRLTYLNLAQAGTSAISVWVWWFIQRHYNLKTKQMFTAATVATVIIPLWGTLGIFTDKIGFHNSWEFWMYNFFVAIFQTPYYAYSVTMMAELTPPGHEKMFFSLYGFSNRASSLIGPSIIQAIINRTGSNWSGFPLLLGFTGLAMVVIVFGVDLSVGRESAQHWGQNNLQLSRPI